MNRARHFHYAFLFLSAFLLYANTLHHGFVLDDYIVITGNRFTTQGIKGIPDIFTHDAFVGTYGEALELSGGRYRPFSIAMFAVEYNLFGLNPFPFHLLNVLLYGFTGILIYRWMSRCLSGRKTWIPFLVATIFIFHPIHTEVVANIKSRDEILALFLLLSSAILLLKKKPAYVLLSGMLFFLALLSKENAITWLAIIPLILWFFTADKPRTIALKTVPFIAFTVLYLLLRSTYAGTPGDRITTDIMDDPYLGAIPSERYATIFLTLGRYLMLLLFPTPLSSDYSYNQIPLTTIGDPMSILSILVYSGGGMYALHAIRRKDIVSFGILLYLIPLSLVSNLFFNIGTSMGERFVYLPSLGFCLLAAVGLAWLLRIDLQGQMTYRPRWIIPLVVILAFCAFKTITRNSAWSDNFTLYSTDVKTVPASARIHLYYGIELIGRYNTSKDVKFPEKAIAEIQYSIRINPRFHHAHFNLAVAYEMAGMHDQAISSYENTLRLQPRHSKSILNLGVLYGKVKGDYNRAISLLSQLLGTNYQSPELFDNLGIAYAMMGDLKKAEEIFLKGIGLYPENARLHFNLAITYSNMGNAKIAEQHYAKAFALDPALKGQGK